jgi:hypothetical protein
MIQVEALKVTVFIGMTRLYSMECKLVITVLQANVTGSTSAIHDLTSIH